MKFRKAVLGAVLFAVLAISAMSASAAPTRDNDGGGGDIIVWDIIESVVEPK